MEEEGTNARVTRPLASLRDRNTRASIGATSEHGPVAAYPNPAKDRLMITWPTSLKTGTLEVMDGRGRMVRSMALNGRMGSAELDVRAWADGLYLARVISVGEVLGETKCAIVR